MKVLVVSCHPCEESFNTHVRERALAVLGATHDVRHVDLYDDPGSAAELAAAEVLVVVYPTWWSSVPAPLVDWLDRCFTAHDRYRRLKMVVAVTSHGSNWWVNLVEGEVGRRILLRGLRRRGHPTCRARWISMYNIDRSTPEDRAKFVAKVERKLGRLRGP